VVNWAVIFSLRGRSKRIIFSTPFTHRTWLHSSSQTQISWFAREAIFNWFSSFIRTEGSRDAVNNISNYISRLRAPFVKSAKWIWRVWHRNSRDCVITKVARNTRTCYYSTSTVLSVITNCASSWSSSSLIGSSLAFHISLIKFSCAL